MKKNWYIIIALLLPVLLILGVFATLYLPSFGVSTKYDFVYAKCDDSRYYYTCSDLLSQKYTVKDGKIVQNDDIVLPYLKEGITPEYDLDLIKYKTRLFVHMAETGENKEISLEDASQFEINDFATSPDGVYITNEWSGSGDFFPFFSSRSSSGYYYSKGKSRKKIELVSTGDRYSNSFYFIGWVINKK